MDPTGWPADNPVLSLARQDRWEPAQASPSRSYPGLSRPSQGGGMEDWMIVLIIGAVVLFGAAKLPEIARNVGRARGEFKRGLKESIDDDPASGNAAQA
jgi:TatA/E family protein of Tat protein translocase